MKFKRHARAELSLNITPLIDVVFLLLIFFMVTTTFSQETKLSVSLPEADAPLSEVQPSQLEVVVSRDGSYSINGKLLVNSDINTLMQGLVLESAGDRTVPVLLIADAQATHQAVVTAMDGIGQSGFTEMSIATRRPESVVDPATDALAQ